MAYLIPQNVKIWSCIRSHKKSEWTVLLPACLNSPNLVNWFDPQQTSEYYIAYEMAGIKSTPS